MLYTIGNRVKLKRTGDTGVISQLLGDELVEVRLDGGFGHIPVPTDALQRAPDDTTSATNHPGARFVPGKSTPSQEVEPVDLNLQYTILKPWGIQLAFDPVLRNDAAPERYRIFLINDTATPIIFRIELQLNKKAIFERVGQLTSGSFVEVGELKHDELNEQPAIDADIRPQIDNGTGPRHHQVLKIKPKLFFNRLRTAPLLNRRVHHFVLFAELSLNDQVAPPKESLANYTKRQIDQSHKKTAPYPIERVPNPQEVAAFPLELDLHIESLVKNPRAIAKSRYLSTQLYYFRRYIQRAQQLDIERVYIIHGLGEGKLKRAVHKELHQLTGVTSFNNNFHPKYGNGATEVILG